LSHTDVNGTEVGYEGKRALVENPDNDAAIEESEALCSEKDKPIRLADGQPVPVPPRAISGAKGLFVYTVIGVILVITGALFGWAIATRPAGVVTASASGNTPIPDCRYRYY
jgi:hypothetical protein